MDVGVDDVDTVFIHKGSVRALPCCDTPAARAQRDGRVFYPCCAETVEEIGLPSYFAVLEICVAQFTYVYLELDITIWVKNKRSRGLTVS